MLLSVVPEIFQRVFVKPDELQLEKPYIERNIALTQQAYNLRQIAAKPFSADQNLTFKALEANKATIDNIRLWDWQPLMDVCVHLQEIRTYYKFHDVDVDRYWLDAAYQSVMLSARELNSSLLPPNTQTWVNRHVLFTHGNGVVMSPVTRKNAEAAVLSSPMFLRSRPEAPKSASRAFSTGKRPAATLSSRGARPSSTTRRGKTTSTPPTTASAASLLAGSQGNPLRLVLQRREPAALELPHRREPDHDPPRHSRTGPHDRSVPSR